jgi:outer membrane protein assembly factor BamE (lipoprotein component of BamABCDE complex)
MLAASTGSRRARLALLAGAMALALAGCNTGGGGFGATSIHGHVVSEQALAQVPIGSSREQVLIALGSPSTTATFSGEVFYYISQTRVRVAQFTQPRVVDQRVVAIYFDSNRRVARIADYGIEDGVVIDFISRTTPTGGEDQTFIGQIFAGIAGRL